MNDSIRPPMPNIAPELSKAVSEFTKPALASQDVHIHTQTSGIGEGALTELTPKETQQLLQLADYEINPQEHQDEAKPVVDQKISSLWNASKESLSSSPEIKKPIHAASVKYTEQLPEITAHREALAPVAKLTQAQVNKLCEHVASKPSGKPGMRMGTPEGRLKMLLKELQGKQYTSGFNPNAIDSFDKNATPETILAVFEGMSTEDLNASPTYKAIVALIEADSSSQVSGGQEVMENTVDHALTSTHPDLAPEESRNLMTSSHEHKGTEILILNEGGKPVPVIRQNFTLHAEKSSGDDANPLPEGSTVSLNYTVSTRIGAEPKKENWMVMLSDTPQTSKTTPPALKNALKLAAKDTRAQEQVLGLSENRNEKALEIEKASAEMLDALTDQYLPDFTRSIKNINVTMPVQIKGSNKLGALSAFKGTSTETVDAKNQEILDLLYVLDNALGGAGRFPKPPVQVPKGTNFGESWGSLAKHIQSQFGSNTAFLESKTLQAIKALYQGETAKMALEIQSVFKGAFEKTRWKGADSQGSTGILAQKGYCQGIELKVLPEGGAKITAEYIYRVSDEALSDPDTPYTLPGGTSNITPVRVIQESTVNPDGTLSKPRFRYGLPRELRKGATKEFQDNLRLGFRRANNPITSGEGSTRRHTT